MVEIEFLGDTKKIIRGWDDVVKARMAHQLSRVRDGLDPVDYKPLPDIGGGVREIRISHKGQWRVVYTAKVKNMVYVLGAFQKKTPKMPKREIDKIKARLKLI